MYFNSILGQGETSGETNSHRKIWKSQETQRTQKIWQKSKYKEALVTTSTIINKSYLSQSVTLCWKLIWGISGYVKASVIEFTAICRKSIVCTNSYEMTS